jgi:hypothetical protein
MLGLTDVTVGVVAVTTVTVAVAVTDVSATDVAVMTTELIADPGAVYTPEFLSIEPFGSREVVLVGTDHVTFRQFGLELMLHPGLLTVAEKVKCSLVPTVAVAGVIVMPMPVTMVSVAVAFLVVSACEVAVIVTVGAIVVVPLEVTVGMVAGALKSPVESMEPHVFAVTFVAQVTDHVTCVLLDPLTRAENG